MNKYLIDFETKSDLSLPVVGTEKYLHTKSSDIVCMAWKKNEETTKLWLPGKAVPFIMEPEDKIYAHNIQFDQRVWNEIGVRKYFFPYLFIDNCIDVMALAGRYTYPQKLDQLGKVLETEVTKDRKGKALMKKICSPPFKFTKQEMFDFYFYCIDDVETMYYILKKLPMNTLSEEEQNIWLSTVKINRAGLPIDIKSAQRIYAVVEYYKEKEGKKVPIITEGVIQKVTQNVAAAEWIRSQGVDCPDLTVSTVNTVLDQEIPDNVREFLEIRQKLGQSSVAKYKKLLEMSYGGWIYDNLRYYGASTGRWAGLAFQLHNLPRATVESIAKTIVAFNNTSILSGDVLYSAKALIRSMIKAPPGYEILVADYKSIENRALAFTAGDTKRLQLFRKGLDEYIDFATTLFGVAYDDVSKEQRFISKVGILGAGYGLAAKGHMKYAAGYGLESDIVQSKAVIDMYRKDHKQVVALWYGLSDAAVDAVLNPGQEHSYNDCSFKVIKDRGGAVWLRLLLPSGRTMFYNSPKVKEGTYKSNVVHMGLNSKTKKWSELWLIPGRITENVCQAISRDILAAAVIRLQDKGYKVIGHVHDEILCLVPKNDRYTLEEMIDIMCEPQPWSADLPLEAEGEVLNRYRKI